jgi:hypothetical protein
MGNLVAHTDDQSDGPVNHLEQGHDGEPDIPGETRVRMLAMGGSGSVVGPRNPLVPHALGPTRALSPALSHVTNPRQLQNMTIEATFKWTRQGPQFVNWPKTLGLEDEGATQD